MSKGSKKGSAAWHKQRMKDFSARGSRCPICKLDFRRGCSHSIVAAEERLKENYMRALIDEQLAASVRPNPSTKM